MYNLNPINKVPDAFYYAHLTYKSSRQKPLTLKRQRPDHPPPLPQQRQVQFLENPNH